MRASEVGNVVPLIRGLLSNADPCLFLRWQLDEICMDSPELLDLAEEVARKVRKSDVLFGGIQLVATGDVAQLPPRPSDEGEGLSVAQLRPRRELAVESRVFSEGGFEVLIFDQVVRQRDMRMIAALGDLSVGHASATAYEFVDVSRGVEFDDASHGVMHIMATNQEVSEWGAAGVRERSQRGGVLAHEWHARVRQGSEAIDELDPEAVKRFQGKVLFDLSLAVGERYLVGPLQDQWKITKFEYATVGEVVEVVSVDVASARVRVRFVYREYELQGQQHVVESYVPLMTYCARHDGATA